MATELEKKRRRLWVGLFVLLFASLLIVVAAKLHSGVPWVFERTIACTTPKSVLGQSIKSLVNWPNFSNRIVKARRISIAGKEFPVVDQEVETGALIRITYAPNRSERLGEDPLVSTPKSVEPKTREITFQVKSFLPEERLLMVVDSDPEEYFQNNFTSLSWELRLDRPGAISARVEGIPASLRSKVIGTFISSMVLLPLSFWDPKALCGITQPRPTLLVPAFQR